MRFLFYFQYLHYIDMPVIKNTLNKDYVFMLKIHF